MIYLFPHSGLANRIRVIVSGLHFAEFTKQGLTVIWKKDNSLYCNFSDIFEKDDHIIIKKSGVFNNLFNTFQSKKIYLYLLKKLYNVDFTLFDKDFRQFIWERNSDDLNLSVLPFKVRNYYISTCNEFFFKRAYLQYLRPIAEIQLIINQYKQQISDKTIGVHIRRTDHLDAIEESPLDAFITAMREKLDAEPGTNYFLATDDEQVEFLLMKLFPTKIIVHKKEFTRQSIQGIKDAVVDLYCLSATAGIYGSYFSSFSDIAARIGNIPLHVIRRPNP